MNDHAGWTPGTVICVKCGSDNPAEKCDNDPEEMWSRINKLHERIDKAAEMLLTVVSVGPSASDCIEYAGAALDILRGDETY